MTVADDQVVNGREVVELRFSKIQVNTNQSTASGGTITGTVTGGPANEVVYLDANNDGLLDNGETYTKTASNGSFEFDDVTPGAYFVTQQLPNNYAQSSPAGGAGIYVSVANGGVYSGNNFTDLTTAPVLNSVQLNGNLAALAGAQRSMIDSVEYTFNQPVILAAANAFSIAVHTGKTGAVPTLTWSALNPDANGYSSTWVVSFSGAGVVGKSIADGVYDLTLNASAATTAGGGVNAASSTTTFARLFGDVTGDGKVNLADFGQLSKSFGSKAGGSTYQAALDYNNDGFINLGDYGQFKIRYGMSFTF